MTVATTAIESAFDNETVDQRSPEEEAERIENYEKEYQSLLNQYDEEKKMQETLRTEISAVKETVEGTNKMLNM